MCMFYDFIFFVITVDQYYGCVSNTNQSSNSERPVNWCSTVPSIKLRGAIVSSLSLSIVQSVTAPSTLMAANVFIERLNTL